MADERCKMCHDAGFPNVIAHYKGIEKGRSHDGKEHPPLCWDHKHGKTPRHILEANGNSTIAGSLPIEESVSPAAEERCGAAALSSIVEDAPRVAKNLQTTSSRPSQSQRQYQFKQTATSRADVTCASIREFTGDAGRASKRTVANVDAVRRVIMLVQGAEKAGSAAEFFGNGTRSAS